MAVRFVVFGDTKGKENGINKKVLQGILEKVKELSLKPDFFISLGDSIAGSSKPRIHRQQMQEFKKTIRRWFPETMFLPVVGNHEVNNEPADDTYEMLFKEEYLTFRQHGALSGFNGTAYYMDLEYCRFIVLNCYHYGHLKKIDHEQLQWFKEVSKDDKKFKLAFVHCPPYPTGAHEGTCLDEFKEYRDSFCRAAEENKIDIIFSGHEHNYSRRLIEGNTAGIQQIISGGGGETLRKSYTSREGVVVPPVAKFHFVVVDMNETSIRVQAVSTEGVSIDLFNINK